MDKNTSEFYERLRTELDNSNVWPAEYLFKFIVPSNKSKIDIVENAFDNLGAVIVTKHSKTGKYTSISVDVRMDSSQDIIDKYLEVSVIEGIISL
jgi:hypothetical protein